MKSQPALRWLSPLIALLAVIAAGAGLLQTGGGAPFDFTTVRGDSLRIYGQGLYRLETPLIVMGYKAADLITLILAVPALIFSSLRYQRGSLKAGLLLAGTLAYFLYNYISVGFGAVYNSFFLAYIGLFSASLFGLVLILASFDLPTLPSRFTDALPRRGIGIYLIISGIVLALVWLVLSIVPALLAGDAPPEVRYYTTFTTGILDVGLVAPALIVSGALLLRRHPAGFLLSATLLVFTVILGAALTAAGMAQVLTGVITIAQALVFTVPFVVLTLCALWFAIRLFRCFSE